MSTEIIFEIVGFVVSLILGEVNKKLNLTRTKLIPLQNLIIGIVVACVEYMITKDFKLSIACSGLMAGGTYDLFHNLNKLKGDDENG